MSVRNILMAAAGAQPSSSVAAIFSAYPYSGTGAAQSLSPGVDLSTYGGLFWSKALGPTTRGHRLFDSARGSNFLDTSTAAKQASNTGVSLTTSGVNLTSNTHVNASGSTYIGWMFRKAAKFFDVVTWTGNGANRTIPHSLGQEVGMMLVKCTDSASASDWQVYHRSLGNSEYMVLNSTAAKATDATRWNSTKATTSNISLGTDATVNASEGTYVAYLFAHDAGADGIVQCGAMTTDASGAATVALGWSPQFVVYKAASTTSNWTMLDTTRGWVDSAGNDDMRLFADSTGTESGAQRGNPTSGGFSVVNESASSSYVYMAIRAA